jgi:hypothetical protein
MKLFESESDEGEAAVQSGQDDPFFTFSNPHFAQITKLPPPAHPLAEFRAR